MDKTEAQTKAQAEALQFLFTEEDFHLDAWPSGDMEEKGSWRSRFEEDRYRALYQMGFEEKMENLTASGGFLHLLSDSFLKRLTSLPELELAREKVELKLSAEDVEALMKAVPFAIGAEYINAKWIKAVFRKLLKIFSGEIAAYNGTVEMYLTEKNQHLHVPERIFFHLVEHKDYDFPFAFLATYATKTSNGKVRHVPLKYALTEYGNEREKLLKLLACLNLAA